MRLAVLTTGRQDWGILRSTCLLLREDPRFDLRLLVGGTHGDAAFGQTDELIAADAFAMTERLDWLSGSANATEAAGKALELIGAALSRQHPEALLLVGDRYETAAAAIAATIHGIPIVHLHGGEETGGAIDDAFRHAVSKLSHLHLVSHPDHARRVEALGEAPATIHVVGAPGLDNLSRADLPDRPALEARLGIPLRSPLVVVTVHPTTLAADDETGTTTAHAVVEAMNQVQATYVITLPNADPGNEPIRTVLMSAAGRPGRVAIPALGDRFFWALLAAADAMLGNSSSALIEAPALGLPAVNVGDRQLGRLRGANVIEARPVADQVTVALRTALEPETRAALRGSASPYGNGHSAERIVAVLADWAPPHPARKAPVRVAEQPGLDLVLIGGGEHARVVLDAARAQGGWNPVGYLDPRRSAELERQGIPWLGPDADARAALAGGACVIAIGGSADPGMRQAIMERYADLNLNWARIVHPSAIVADSAVVDPGVVILARAVVNPGAHIGRHAIVNTGAIVEHDVSLGPGVHVAPGAVIGGGATVDAAAFIGMGARVRDHVHIGAAATVGMGAVVVSDIPTGATAVGVPARPASAGVTTTNEGPDL